MNRCHVFSFNYLYPGIGRIGIRYVLKNLGGFIYRKWFGGVSLVGVIFSSKCLVTDASFLSGGAAGNFEGLEGVFAGGVEGEGVRGLGCGWCLVFIRGGEWCWCWRGGEGFVGGT